MEDIEDDEMVAIVHYHDSDTMEEWDYITMTAEDFINGEYLVEQGK